MHGHESSVHERLRAADTQLSGRTIDDIFDQGLHQFLSEFIADTRALSGAIAQDYRFNA